MGDAEAAERERPQLVLVADRLRYVEPFRALASRVTFWGYGAAAGHADVPLKDAIDDPPELPRDAVFFVDLHAKVAERMVAALKARYPRVALVLDRRSAGDHNRHEHLFVAEPGEWFEHWLARRRDMAQVRGRVEQLKALIAEHHQVLILTHPNPDPDAIAAALGMRAVLGRNRQTATIGYLGRPLARPENLAMVELLEIDLERIEPQRLKSFDAIILVDCQENVFAKFPMPPIAAVVDHHPERSEFTSPYRDVVPEEGSTSTIITRYLQALEQEPSQRLATALLYGVKSDTFFLKREVNVDDIESFMFLYPRANVNILRRIEIPELPLDGMHAMGAALQAAELVEGVFCAEATGPHATEDLVARLADLGLQLHNAQWSVSLAAIRGAVIISVRNVGYVRHAGRAVDEAFGRLGPSGGHRSAARAILDVDKVREELGAQWQSKLRGWVLGSLLKEIRPEEGG